MATSPPPPPRELDTTMEDADDDESLALQRDDEFSFDAPSYYDLRHPERERRYVNNADGYFYQPNQQLQPLDDNNHEVFDGAVETEADAPATPVREKERDDALDARTPQTPFGRFREAPASEDSDAEMADAPDDDDAMSDSDETLVLEPPTPPAPAPTQAPTRASQLPPPSSVPSSLLQPTKAYLLRLQAEQAKRALDESHVSHDGHGNGSKLTRPRSPQLRTSQKALHRQQSEPKLSSTSRELQRIQEEKMRLQLETLKVREFHERVRAQRVPANVHQRSTKQLTIPQSPHLEAAARSRRALNLSAHSSSDDTAERDEPHPFIAPEQLLSRDFEFPATATATATAKHHPHDVTVPQTPQLRTSARAAARGRGICEDASPERPHRVDYAKMKVNGVTRPLSPQFETDRRAAQAAAYRKPIEVVDKDAEELQRKFHARPVPRRIFEAPRSNGAAGAAASTAPLTRPVSPKLATSARARSSFHETNEPPPVEKKPAPKRTGPVVPETPPLRSIQRHQLYQEQLRRRKEQEEEEMRRQREFKAQPIRLVTTPPKFEGSKKPLTEVQPFALRGDRIHERAQERLERLRREEEERLRAAAQFKAKPMPDLSAAEEEAAAARNPGPQRVVRVTKPSTPKFATDRRAAERAAFEAAERERRAREEEQKRQAEAEKRRQEEEEIKRLRREQLTFHARPVPAGKSFEVKPSSRNLTEPESPFLQTKVRGGSATTAA